MCVYNRGQCTWATRWIGNISLSFNKCIEHSIEIDEMILQFVNSFVRLQLKNVCCRRTCYIYHHHPSQPRFLLSKWISNCTVNMRCTTIATTYSSHIVLYFIIIDYTFVVVVVNESNAIYRLATMSMCECRYLNRLHTIAWNGTQIINDKKKKPDRSELIFEFIWSNAAAVRVHRQSHLYCIHK